MEKYEYKQFSYDDIYYTIDQSNEIGKEGWEMVSFTRMPVGDDQFYLLTVFKRRVRNKLFGIY